MQQPVDRHQPAADSFASWKETSARRGQLQPIRELAEMLVASAVVGTLMFFTPVWGPRAAYAGLTRSRRPRSRRLSSKFGLADFGCLFVYVAVANGLFLLVRDEDEFRFLPLWRAGMAVLCNVFAVLTWWLAVRFADDNAIAGTRSRTLAQLIFWPLSAVSVSQIILMTLMLLPGLEFFKDGFRVGARRYFADPVSLGSIATLLFSVLTLWLLRRGFAYIVDHPTERGQSESGQSRVDAEPINTIERQGLREATEDEHH